MPYSIVIQLLGSLTYITIVLLNWTIALIYSIEIEHFRQKMILRTNSAILTHIENFAISASIIILQSINFQATSFTV